MLRPLTADIRADRAALDVGAYEAAGGYQGLRKALAMNPVQVQQTVTASGLRGRGGAGFPTGMKWSFVPMGTGPVGAVGGTAGGSPDTDGHRYMVVNADEKEPGTMKDRWLMEGNPHELIEGALIAAWAMQADIAYIFLRREYSKCAASLTKAMEEARQKKYIGQRVLGTGWNLEMRLHLSAGRYMCGEESGLLNALEGRRGIPRNKPPFPQVSGLWGRPTVVNNVETLCNIPHILREGPEWYKALSTSPDSGTKIYGVSGKVKKPGLWELPIGTTIREILEEHAGGMADGLTLRGLIPGGASTDFLTADQLDVRMDFDSVAKAGSRLGTGTMVVKQTPEPGKKVEKGETVSLILNGESHVTPDGMMTVPDVRGMSIRRAMNRLVSDEFEVKVQGSGVVIHQIPDAGGRVRSGSNIMLLCSPRSVTQAMLY